MKQALIAAFILCSGALFAQGIEFFDGSWEEALEAAEQENKLIFVDGYASWCGPCKRMARDVFPDAEVGSFFNDNFISLKLDMEKGQGVEFRKNYPVRAFPTLFFIASNGKIVIKETGARRANDLIALGQKAIKKSDQSDVYLKLYEQGDRDFKTVYNLVRSLNSAGKPSLQIANEYIDSQSDLNTPDNLRFLLEAASEIDSRIFDLLVDHKSAVIKQEGQQKWDDKVYAAGMRTAMKAANYKEAGLLKAVQKSIKKHVPSKSADFDFYSSTNYSKITADVDSYIKATKKYAKSEVKGDARRLHRLSKEIVQHWKKDDGALAYAEELAAEAAKNGGSSIYYYQLGEVQHLRGNDQEAIGSLEMALSIAKDENANPTRINALLKKLQEG